MNRVGESSHNMIWKKSLSFIGLTRVKSYHSIVNFFKKKKKWEKDKRVLNIKSYCLMQKIYSWQYFIILFFCWVQTGLTAGEKKKNLTNSKSSKINFIIFKIQITFLIKTKTTIFKWIIFFFLYSFYTSIL